MEDEFYATIKLISGEEVVAKVSYITEEKSIFLFQPMLVEMVKQRKHGQTVEGFHLVEWLHATYDDSFIIPMEKIITISELDKRIERYYINIIEGSEEETDEEPGRVPSDQLTTRMGYLGSINETKKALENIFKRS